MTLLLPESVRARGNVRPADDVDFWSFTAAAGDRVYAATMGALSSPTTGDTLRDVIAPDGTPQAATAGAAEARRRMVRSAPR